MNRMIFKIQRFCYGDGPGIRTTVFMKGCPLHCVWCHNPESQKYISELGYSEERCIGCKRCAQICPMECHRFENGFHYLERKECIYCGKCTEICPTEALTLWGRESNADAIIKEVLKDKAYYRDGGGMTISGGEPLAQPQFLLEILKKAKDNGIHTCLDTTGYAETEIMESVIPYVDLFLYDIKHYNASEHKKYTGCENGRILNNLYVLNKKNADVWLRCPIIPGVNDNEQHMRFIGDIAKDLNCIKEIYLLPYHDLWKHKAKELGRNTFINIEDPDPASVQKWKIFVSEICHKPVKMSTE